MKIFIEKACGPPFDLKLPNFYPDCVWKNRTQPQTQRCVWCKRKRTPDYEKNQFWMKFENPQKNVKKLTFFFKKKLNFIFIEFHFYKS